MVGIISVVIGGHFGGGDHFDGGDHFGGGTDLQAHRKRGKSARASPTPHHTLHEERSARFTAQPLSALLKACIVRYSTVRIEVLQNLRDAGIFQISTIQKPLIRPGVKLDEKMSIFSSTPSTSTLA